MRSSSKDAILAAARRAAQAHGYNGLNFRDLAVDVGIKAASLYHHFPSKAALGAAVAKRYREDASDALEALAIKASDPIECLRAYPGTFRAALVSDNRMCLASFMAAEYDDLPEPVKAEVQAFADVNVSWLTKRVTEAQLVPPEKAAQRSRGIFAAVAGAQLMARSRSDAQLFDDIVDSYRSAGLLPTLK